MTTFSNPFHNKKYTTKQKIQTALLAALLCIMGPLTIPVPFSPVPLSLTILGLFLIAYILGSLQGFISCALYIAIGFLGLPVYSSFQGGPGCLFGPTGGYIWGYLFLVGCSGFFIKRAPRNRFVHLLGMCLGLLGCYTFGTLWLAWQSDLPLQVAIGVGCVPFIAGDVLKILCALYLGPKIKARLQII